ncbi:MFS transporter, partial [Streptomyces sp. LNU-CPARS28]|uniref:MFS transporter n=1 Tax=Streptomyces sp. LNU-CPARS28 TaxID=3137371 RepID=UPI0031357988
MGTEQAGAGPEHAGRGPGAAGRGAEAGLEREPQLEGSERQPELEGAEPQSQPGAAEPQPRPHPEPEPGPELEGTERQPQLEGAEPQSQPGAAEPQPRPHPEPEPGPHSEPEPGPKPDGTERQPPTNTTKPRPEPDGSQPQPETTDPQRTGRPTSAPPPTRPLPTALLTCAMAFSMLQLFLLGALGPRLVDELDISPTVLGLTTTIGFGTAAVLSPAGGRIVDRVGPRRALAALLLLSAVALALIGAAPGAGFLLAAVALGGLPQALANPATNKAILASVEPARRGAVTGMKQSGVQLGAFAAGLPLAALAGWLGWRG